MMYHAGSRRENSNKTRTTIWKWIWCISLQCLISVAAEDSVAVYPEGDIFLRYGENLEIFCVAGADSTYEDLGFMLSGKTLKSEMVNRTTIRLFRERPPEHTWLRYYCSNRKTGRNAIKSVVVASPPKKVKDFECVSKNLEELVCSWTSQDLIVPTDYFLTFVFNGYVMKTCRAETLDGTLRKYCKWSSNSSPSYRQQLETYELHLRAEIVANGILMTNEEVFTIDHFSIVNPDPPMNLRVLNKTPHSVELSWNIHDKIVDFLPGGIEHRIEYQIGKSDDASHFHRINTSDLPNNNRTYRFNITDLPYAYTQYDLRMSIKPLRAKNNKFWSGFSLITFYTDSKRPNRPPKIAAGAFRQNNYKGHRVINVYWEQLEENEESGANFTYTIVVKHGLDTQTLFPDKYKSLGLLVLDKAPLDAIDVFVWSINEKGSSVNKSHLYIPPEKEMHSQDITSFSIYEENSISHEHTTYELSWKRIDKIDNYTIFWCQYITTLDICKSRISFEVLDNTKNKYVINLPKNHTYRFAISANKESRTSGMIWAKCVTRKDEMKIFGFPIRFEEDAISVSKTTVKLRWAMDCILKEGIITGYKITYHPIANGDIHVIPKSVQINNIKQTDLTIKELTPYTTYEFTIELYTIYALKTKENKKIHIKTLEDKPTSPRNLQIFNVTKNSLVMSWDSPLSLNGDENRTIYVINSYGIEMKTVKYENKNTILKLDKLNSFTNYSLSIKACNMQIAACSPATDATVVRTAIGPPSAPINLKLNDNLLTWEPPQNPGGNVKLYEIKIVEDQNKNNSDIFKTSNLKYDVTTCEGEVLSVKYQVRAVNFVDDIFHGAAFSSKNVTLVKRAHSNNQIIQYPGEWSNEVSVNCKSNTNFIWIYIFIGVFLAIGAGKITLIFYKKIKNMMEIPPPKFPTGTFDALDNDQLKNDSERKTTETSIPTLDDITENPPRTEEHKYVHLQPLEDEVTHPPPLIAQPLMAYITLDPITDKYMRNTGSHGRATEEAAVDELDPTMKDQGYCQMSYKPGVPAEVVQRPTQGYCLVSYNPDLTAEPAMVRPTMNSQGYCQVPFNPDKS